MMSKRSNYESVSGGFTATAASDVVGVAQATVVAWGGRGLVDADARASEGQGSPKKYKPLNLVQMRVVKELFKRGLTQDQVKRLDREKVRRWFDPSKIPSHGVEWLMVIDGDEWFVEFVRTKTGKKGGILSVEDINIERALGKAKWVLSINLNVIKQEIADAAG